ncbi:RNA polymerase sigma factor [Aquipuribacter nitratireducens]|uniref:RNA polymerase sigma factor n=1 Tax=Aquipuribacter nitratireducens TaxID=650104 RepID=A0ABW0GLX6_9MICO
MREEDGDASRDAVEVVVRESYGRLVAYLAVRTRDVAAAEDALSDALVAALRTWPERGVPERPEAWLLTAARRGHLDTLRRRTTAERALPELARLADEHAQAGPASTVPDTRLQLMFACAHPAIAPAVRGPLMLQVVLGLDAVRIGRVHLVPATTMGQRLVRAKAKIAAAGIPFAVPEGAELPARLGAVLDALHAAYTAGWDEAATPDGEPPGRGDDLTGEVLRLTRLVVRRLPEEPEARGLLAAVLHVHARRGARRDGAGRFVPLAEQDPQRWDADLVREAEEHLLLAQQAGVVGPYQLMGAVQSVHAHRAVTGRTDHVALARLYEGLVALQPTTGAKVAHAAAVLAAHGSVPALAILDALAREDARSAGYQPYWVVRAATLADLDPAAAGAARRRAADLTHDPAVRDHLVRA